MIDLDEMLYRESKCLIQTSSYHMIVSSPEEGSLVPLTGVPNTLGLTLTAAFCAEVAGLFQLRDASVVGDFVLLKAGAGFCCIP